MNIDQLRNWFPDETACRQFFETARWPNGRICPHCGHHVSYVIHASHRKSPCYQCKSCKRQFTVTTKTVLHSTKLKLWKWVQAIHLIMNSSKGISSVVLARMIGTTQPTAWKVGHAIRRLMDSNQFDKTLLTGIVELDEMYVGGDTVSQPGVVHKRGKGTSKQ
jgi:transposase-like protein